MGKHNISTGDEKKLLEFFTRQQDSEITHGVSRQHRNSLDFYSNCASAADVPFRRFFGVKKSDILKWHFFLSWL